MKESDLIRNDGGSGILLKTFRLAFGSFSISIYCKRVQLILKCSTLFLMKQYCISSLGNMEIRTLWNGDSVKYVFVIQSEPGGFYKIGILCNEFSHYFYFGHSPRDQIAD